MRPERKADKLTTFMFCHEIFVGQPLENLRRFFFILFILGARSITSVMLHATIYIHFLHFCYFYVRFYVLLVFLL